MCRLINLLATLKFPHHKLRLSRGVKSDLRLWLHFLQFFNGVGVVSFAASPDKVTLITDASKVGFGAILFPHYTSREWPPTPDFFGTDIAFLELYAVFIGFSVWAEKVKDKWMYVQSDNKDIVLSFLLGYKFLAR